MKNTFFLLAIFLFVSLGCESSPPLTGPAEILKSWHGDFPVAELDRLPEGQREQGIGYIGDPQTFEGIWKAFQPGEDVQDIDFKANLVIFARNTQFYNRIRIGQVNVIEGVVEVLAMETMSAAPIEEKVAVSLAVVGRKGITGLKIGDETIPLE